jgi:single-strand DNA-binding protein
MYMNQLTIIGFTGQDADFHYTPNGTAVTTFSVATKESWKNDKGEWQSRTDWHRVVTFGKLADYKNLTEGSTCDGARIPTLPRVRERRCSAPNL